MYVPQDFVFTKLNYRQRENFLYLIKIKEILYIYINKIYAYIFHIYFLINET